MKNKYLPIFVMLTSSVMACPFCGTKTSGDIRAVAFGQDMTYNITVSIIPFVIFGIVTYFIYKGIPLKKRTAIYK